MSGTWLRTRLKNLVEPIQNGVWGADPAGDDDDILCVRVADFDRQRFGLKSVETVRSVPARDRASRLLRAGDILLEKSGGTDSNPVGFTVMFDGDYPAVTSNFVGRVRMRVGQHPKFWLYALAASYVTRRTQKCVRQTTGIQNLDQSAYLQEVFPVPPLEEQRAIADYLDRETARIDALIEEQQRLIEMLRERRQAVVDESLQPDADWGLHALKFALEGIDQGVSPQAESDLAREPGSWGVLKSGCVNRGVFNPLEHKRLPDDFAVDERLAVSLGDLLVSRASGSPDLVGSAGSVDRLGYNLILSDKLFRLRLRDGHEPRFFYWLLNSRHYRTQVRQSISGAEGLANNLPLSALRNFSVAVAPAADQRRIAASLDEQTTKIDQLIAETERFIELSKERRAALITAAVTGQIDVRDEVA